MAAISQLLSALKKVGVNKAYRRVESFMPDWFNAKVSAMSDRYIFKPLVFVDEIKPVYKKAVDYLMQNVGSEKIGDYLEFGVCHGTSLSCMYKVLEQKKIDQVRLFGFDSFEGLPSNAAAEDDNHWVPGEFACAIEDTTKNLTKNGVDWNRTTLVKGWYSDTLKPEFVEENHIDKASLIMVDCDIYSSTKEALDFCAPLIKDKSVIFFDDWQPGKNMGEEKAFMEFKKDHPEFKVEKFGSYKPTGEVFLIEKNRVN